MNKTELRYLYACLSFASDKMSAMGCNDWSVDNPDTETLAFMQAVEDMVAAQDSGHEREVLKPGKRVYGVANWLAAVYLMRRMEDLHGEEMFAGCNEGLGLR